MDELLPQDIVDEDTVEQARMRREVMEGGGRQEGVVRNLEVVERELEDAIKRFKNKKAPGEDGIKAEVLKSVGGVMKGQMARLMVMIWEEGVFPKLWKKGIIKLIMKGEDKPEGEIKSYRPVTLLPVMGKLAERVIAGWLQDEISDKLNPGQ